MISWLLTKLKFIKDDKDDENKIIEFPAIRNSIQNFQNDNQKVENVNQAFKLEYI